MQQVIVWTVAILMWGCHGAPQSPGAQKTQNTRPLLAFAIPSSPDTPATPQSEVGQTCDSDAQCRSGSCRQRLCAPKGLTIVPRGSFTMGTPPAEQGRFSLDGPSHSVTISRPFYMQETEVTHADRRRVMETRTVPPQGCGEDCPVSLVNWFDVAAYANTLSQRQGLQPCYVLSQCSDAPAAGCPRSGSFKCNGRGTYHCKSVKFVGLTCTGYRLPTEAEWEYAARAGTTQNSYGGEIPSTQPPCAASTVLDSIAWYCKNSENIPHPVAQKEPNLWGLYDMIGNVSEWVHDHAQTYSSDRATDPIGAQSGRRIHRGGAYNAINFQNRVSVRSQSEREDNRLLNRGFRLVRTL